MCCGRKAAKKPPSRFKHFKPKPQNLQALAEKKPAIKTFLMCRPNFYDIKYEINPWTKVSNKINKNLAIEQWTNLYDRIIEHGGEVRMLKDQENALDMVFTANAATVIKESKTVIISNFKYQERKVEEEWIIQWFTDENWKFEYPPFSYEGNADSLKFKNNFVCAHGIRSELITHKKIAETFNINSINVKIKNPLFFQLDLCFCPLNDEDYLIFPDVFDEESLDSIRKLGGREIAVSEDEAIKMACNSICIGKTVIIPNNCPKTMQKLFDIGYNPVSLEMSEFIKSGGACKALALEI